MVFSSAIFCPYYWKYSVFLFAYSAILILLCVHHVDIWLADWLNDELGGQKNTTKILVTSYVGNKESLPCNDKNACTSIPIGQMGDLGAVIFQKNTGPKAYNWPFDIYCSSVFFSLPSYL